jgi:DNA-binding GntR family transcriptional regulator
MKDRSGSHETARARKVDARLTAGFDNVNPEDGSQENRTGTSLSDTARIRFLEALFERRLQPGAFVSQGELVKLLDIPVGPLRDALRVLQTEGWLTIHARSGIELRKPDFDLVRHSYQLRLVLERAAIRSFAEMAPRSQIDALEARHRKIIADVGGQELSVQQARDIEKVDWAFHLEVISVLKNPMIDRAYQQAQSFVHLIRLDREYRLSWPVVIRTMNEHLKIISACSARDAAAAEAALEAHFAQAMQRAIGFY